MTELLIRQDGYPRGRSSRERGMPDARCSSSALFSSQSSQSVADAEEKCLPRGDKLAIFKLRVESCFWSGIIWDAVINWRKAAFES